MSNFTVTRKLKFDAAHRVMRHESKCATLHGHEYRVEITCEATSLDNVGRVVDFGVIKERVGAWIDQHWDHGTLVNGEDIRLREWLESNTQKHFVFGSQEPGQGGEPTAENIAKELYKQTCLLLPGKGLRVAKIRVWETINSYADYTEDSP